MSNAEITVSPQISPCWSGGKCWIQIVSKHFLWMFYPFSEAQTTIKPDYIYF